MDPLRRAASSPLQGDHTSSPAEPVLRCVPDMRVQALVDFYRHVHHERMQGIPLLNPALQVEAVGFQWVAAQEGAVGPVAEGVLITPWFMSLVRLPLAVEPHRGRVARKAVHAFGNERFEFIGAHDARLGHHETCALFSPMGGFLSQAQAVETALASLVLLRPAPAPETAARPVPARRAFFSGRLAAPETSA
jgi:[NiFe] hydrogenase assembly HybE family chaperone